MSPENCLKTCSLLCIQRPTAAQKSESSLMAECTRPIRRASTPLVSTRTSRCVALISGRSAGEFSTPSILSSTARRSLSAARISIGGHWNTFTSLDCESTARSSLRCMAMCSISIGSWLHCRPRQSKHSPSQRRLIRRQFVLPARAERSSLSNRHSVPLGGSPTLSCGMSAQSSA